MRILYVEDYPGDAELIRHTLAGERAFDAIEVVPTLASAYERLKTPECFDLVLCDMRLPDGNGLELLAHVRRERLPLAFVILTGASEEDSVINALRDGADDYVFKRDEDLRSLSRTLQAALARYREDTARQTRQLRILYVDHDPTDIELTCRRFAGHAPYFRIDTCGTGDAAIEKLRSCKDEVPWDLLLLDHHVAGCNGLDIAKRVRNELRLDLPIVLIANEGAGQIAVQALRLGISECIVKHPGYLDLLPATLEKAIDQAQLRRQATALRARTHQLNHMLAAHPSVLFWLRYVDNQIVEPALWVSDNMPDVLGYTKVEEIDRRWMWERLTPAEKERYLKGRKRLFDTGRSEQDIRFQHKNGRVLWIRIDARITKRGPDNSGELITTWTDITEHKEAELRLAESEAKYRLIAESMEDVIWQTSLDLVYIYVTPSVERQLGYKPEEMIGHSIFDFVPDDLKAAVKKRVADGEAARASGNPWPTQSQEYRQVTKDGKRVWIETRATAIMCDGKVVAYQGVSRDVTARKTLEERMNFLTHNDPLTGLPNRRLFEIHLEHTLEAAHGYGQKVAILLIDLDHFKTINDSLGHTVGDELLKKVAERLASALRSRDTLARLGGDEFGVLLPHLDNIDEASHVAQDLLEALDHVMTLPNGSELDIGASIGISLFPDHALNAGELIQYADTALYRAKAEGRRMFRHFTEELTHAARERLSLESNLRHAIEREELEVYYQPIVDIRSGRIVGAEALLRWHGPDGHIVMPDRFIPIAEESGLILPIGEWVLKTACAQVQRWNATGPQTLFMTVNLSPRQFSQRDLAERIQAILNETKLNPALLELEITESALVPEGEHAGVLLERLKATGASLAIDDFGTGYSSLAYLQRFPFDTLKIDKRFVQNVTERKDDTVIVTSIIRLAQSLNFSLLAEGVETKEQLNFLRTHGCDLYQGFLRSKAVTAEEFARLLAVRSTDAAA